MSYPERKPIKGIWHNRVYVYLGKACRDKFGIIHARNYLDACKIIGHGRFWVKCIWLSRADLSKCYESKEHMRNVVLSALREYVDELGNK